MAYLKKSEGVIKVILNSHKPNISRTYTTGQQKYLELQTIDDFQELSLLKLDTIADIPLPQMPTLPHCTCMF